MKRKTFPLIARQVDRKTYLVYFALSCLILISLSCVTRKTEDWLTYRHDNGRSGISEENFDTPLSLRWTFKPTHKPKPAWPIPGEEMERTHFDNAYHVTAAHGLVYFGSSVDNKVYALNAGTGKIQWTFYTEGPVRYAPTIWENRIYFGSDDGHVYCLNARNGKSVWKYRAGPSDEKVLGNGRMISLWPVRTSILVDDGVAYFGAGVFPYEGVYICALNADDGTVVWKNDTIGDRSHEQAFGGISPQSYLIASKNILYVPSGRAMPAAFGLKSGQFLYYLLPGGKVGGTWALLDEGNLIAGVDQSGTPAKRAYDEQSGKRKSSLDDMHAWFPGTDLIVTPEVSYSVTKNGVFALDREKYLVLRGKELNAIVEKRQKLRNRLSDLQAKMRITDEETGESEETEPEVMFINPLIEEIERELLDLADEEKKLKESLSRWKYPHSKLHSLILAGATLVAGGEGIVVTLDTQTGKELWEEEVEGNVQGLAAADGNLFISADNGNIYCLGEGKISKGKEISTALDASPFREDSLTSIYESTAEKIIRESGVEKGYCLVLDCETGRLAYELAKRSELKIIGIADDPEKVGAVKLKLDSAGLYGSRVVVEQWDLEALPDYFANLIVSEKMMITGETKESPEQMFRVLKPFGGVAYFGQPVEAFERGKPLELQDLREWLEKSGAVEPEITQDNGIWAKVIRGKLEGIGSWTEQYGNPQNTACSGDQLVKGSLGVLWFGEPGPEKMVDRHAKAASPVSMNGRLFIQGEEVIMAYDVYNGIRLWEREIAGAVRPRADIDGGNLVVTDNSLFVAAYDKCYCLDPATGKTIQVYEIPPSRDGSPHRWGYLSYTDGILYGSRAVPLDNEYFALWEICTENGRWKDSKDVPLEYRDRFESLIQKFPMPDKNDKKIWDEFKRSGILWRIMTDYPEWEIYKSAEGALTKNIMLSDMLFAMNPETGELLWEHQENQIAHITVSIGDGRIFFAESSVSAQQRRRALADRQSLIRRGIYEESDVGKFIARYSDVRNVMCLDAVTGKRLWRKPMDFTGCGGDALATAYQDGVLLFFGSVGDHDAWRFKNGSLRWKRLTVLSADNGGVLWSRPINYRTRPVIVGDQVFIEPRACDLRTGEIKMRTHPITGEQVPWEYLRPGHTCAITSASAHALFYRSYCKGFYDFSEDNGLVLFGGIRPGCWISMIPANGVLLSPEASAGCTCSFPIKCSVVFKRKEKRARPWTVYITHGAMSSAKHFAINLGAPADMKDDEGNVWFGYPNPKTVSLSNHFPGYGVKFDLKDKIRQGMGYFCRDFKGVKIEGTDRPWLFTSGCVGLLRCEVPLIDDEWGEKPAVYTVRLGFNVSSGDKEGQRVFDIMLQGNPVLEGLDIIKETGTSNEALIREFKGIEVKDVLAIEFSSKEENPTLDQAPIVNFIEVIREDSGESAEDTKPVPPMAFKRADVLLREASLEFSLRNPEKALAKYHDVLDAAPSMRFKRQAMKGLADIGSPKSLSRLARYCRDVDPILWNYKDPDLELQSNAAMALIAIANNTAKQDKEKAVKILKNALEVASAVASARSAKQEARSLMVIDNTVYKKIVASLKDLGAEIEE